MTNDELIVKRLENLERQVAPLAAFAQAAGELREEIAPRINEAVQALIVELADIESDFQIEDLLYLLKKLMRNIGTLNYVLDQTQNLVDFAQTAEPLLKNSVPQVIAFLDGLEQGGVFRLLSIATEVLRKIGSTVSPEDMHQIGDGIVRLVGVLKRLTAPAAIDLLERAADVPARVDLSSARPVGLWGMVGAMGDPDVQKGLGVLMEFTKGLGALKA
uniref:DUF1641 domain-containing protein n=1 Tax=Desulfatirhabdium butyrativorans TaxID=340467 RepID=A0A7C4RMV2_9BACT